MNRYLFEVQSVTTYSNIYSKTIQQVGRYMPFVEIDDMVFYGPEGAWSAVSGPIETVKEIYADPNTLQIKVFLTIVPLGKQTTLSLDVKV